MPTKRNLENKADEQPSTSKRRKEIKTESFEVQEEIVQNKIDSVKGKAADSKDDTETENCVEQTDKDDCKLPDGSSKQCADVPDRSNPMALLFKQIAGNGESVRMPISWLRTNVSWNKNEALAFVRIIGLKRKNGQLDSACHKNITIDKNMSMAITINGRHIEHTSFGLESNKL